MDLYHSHSRSTDLLSTREKAMNLPLIAQPLIIIIIIIGSPRSEPELRLAYDDTVYINRHSLKHSQEIISQNRSIILNYLHPQKELACDRASYNRLAARLASRKAHENNKLQGQHDQ
jgi:hypothetical protein